jgi:hypothetical protein
MALTLVELLAPYNSPAGLLNAGEICGLPSAIASAMVTAGTAALYNAGAGSGTPTTSPFRGIGAGETPAAYEAAGGAADTTPSAAVQGFLGEGSIIDGRLVPTALVGDKAQG